MTTKKKIGTLDLVGYTGQSNECLTKGHVYRVVGAFSHGAAVAGVPHVLVPHEDLELVEKCGEGKAQTLDHLAQAAVALEAAIDDLDIHGDGPLWFQLNDNIWRPVGDVEKEVRECLKKLHYIIGQAYTMDPVVIPPSEKMYNRKIEHELNNEKEECGEE